MTGRSPITVTIWHLNPRERYKTHEDVYEVRYTEAPDTIYLYSRPGVSDGGLTGHLIASYGPGFCWAVESHRETT